MVGGTLECWKSRYRYFCMKMNQCRPCSYLYHPSRVGTASGHCCLLPGEGESSSTIYLQIISTNKCIFLSLFHCNVKTDFKKSKLCIESWQRLGNMATIVIVCRGQSDQSSSKICITGYNNVFFHFTKNAFQHIRHSDNYQQFACYHCVSIVSNDY